MVAGRIRVHKMKKLIFAIFTVFLILTLSGCGGGVNYKSTTEEIRTKVTSNYDSYKKFTTIVGPKMDLVQSDESVFFGRMNAKWFIRGWKYRDGSESYQIYVSDKISGGGFRNFYSATSNDGNEHKFTRIDTDVDVSCWGGQYAGCNTYYTEDFGIGLSKGDMDAGLKDGINIKVYSKSGKTRTIIVNPKYINAILDVADANYLIYK
jgi:hypothetical protein